MSGTSLATYWNGVEIDARAGIIAGFNNVRTFTFSDWGFGPGGTVVGDDFTSGEMRLGNINIAGPGGHDIAFAYDAVVLKDTEGGTYVFDPGGDGIPSAVPETSSFALFAGFCVLAGALLARRHC